MRKDPVCGMEVHENDAVTAEYSSTTYYFCSQGCKHRFLDEKTGKVSTSYELIIIGGGPAGLTAAVYAAILKMNTVIIAKDLGGQAIDSTNIENYMGFDFVTGPELIDKFRSQLIHSHYIDHHIAYVAKVEPDNGGFVITTSEGKKYEGKALIIATGMIRRKLEIPGEEKFQRKGIFYGNIQDFSCMHGEDVAVIGGGNSALQIVENLHTVAKTIHLISNSKLNADPVIIERISKFENLIKYEGYTITEFSGNNQVANISIREKTAGKRLFNLPAKGIFIAIGMEPNSSLVSHLVTRDTKDKIAIHPDCSTSFPGIFSAGDVTTVFGERIIIASGEGAKAALAVRQYILNLHQR